MLFLQLVLCSEGGWRVAVTGVCACRKNTATCGPNKRGEYPGYRGRHFTLGHGAHWWFVGLAELQREARPV